MALIIADPGVFQIAKEVCPEIERHVSTQADKHKLCDLSVLVWTRGKACRLCKRVIDRRNQRDPGTYPG